MSLYVDIYKDFGKFQLSMKFEAQKGVTGILGASGCGKSMTLRCIAGVVKPDVGRIVLDGTTLFDSERKINLPPQKRHLGLLFQNYALFPDMTVKKNLLCSRRAVERDRKKAEKKVTEVMEQFYLTGLENHRPAQLSGGQQQRVALARILLTNPGLLLLDEPFSALDDYLRWKLEMELMDILKELDIPALFVSHSRDEIYRICDQVCVMDRGSSTPTVPVKAMFEKPGTLAACLLSGCKNYSAAEPDETEEGWIYARDWGIRLNCGCRVPGNITCIGVRSHYIHPEGSAESGQKPNRIECKICRIVEDVFNMVIMVRPLQTRADSDNALLRLEMPKDQWENYTGQIPAEVGDRMWVWIDPGDILMLL